MKELLCWSIGDILNLKLNSRKRTEVWRLTVVMIMILKVKEGMISPQVRRKLSVILAQDYKVYSHFTPIFEKRLERFGQNRVEEELRELRKANEAVKKRCKISPVDNRKISGANKWWGKAELVGYQVRTCGLEWEEEYSQV